MLTASTTTLGLIDIWQDSDPEHARLRVNFPLNRAAGTDGSAVVYFEVEPGNHLPSHQDSPEEVLYVIAGTAEATVGDERGILRAGDLAVIPAMVPHGLRNIGDETVRVVGFFDSADVKSWFEEPLQPAGEAIVEMAPIPVPA